MDLIDIQESILAIWNLTDRSTSIVWDYEKNYNYIALYVLEGNQIIVELESVLLAFEQAAIPGLSLGEYAQLVFLHELGHSLDPLLNEHYLERMDLIHFLQQENLSDEAVIVLEFEIVKLLLLSEYRAWKLGRQLLPSHLSREQFYQVMRACFKNYEMTFDPVLISYKLLTQQPDVSFNGIQSNALSH